MGGADRAMGTGGEVSATGEPCDAAAVLEALIAATPPGEGATLVVSTALRVERSLAVPAHVAVQVEDGGVLELARGARLRVEGPLRAAARRIFAGEGRVSVGAASGPVLPQWWGAAGDGRADDTAALRLALFSLPARGGRLSLPGGVYRVASTLTLSDRTDCQVAFTGGAALRFTGEGGFALEVHGCDRWMLRDPRIALDAGAEGGIRVAGSRRGMLHRPHVQGVADAVAVAVEGSPLVEVYEPRLHGADAGWLAAGVSLGAGSDGCRVTGGEVGCARVGVLWDSCDGGMLDGTRFDEVRTGLVLASRPDCEASSQFTAASARFERVECGVEIRSVPGRGSVRPPVLTDLRHLDTVELVRCIPGAAYRLIAPVQERPARREEPAAPSDEDARAASIPPQAGPRALPRPAAARSRRWSAPRPDVPRSPAA